MDTVRRPRLFLARLLCGCAGVLAAAVGLSADNRLLDPARAQSWVDSPYRRFGPAHTLLPGRAILFDEADDPELRAALAGSLRKLFSDLYVGQGWRVPFAEDEPLRIYVTRREAEGVRRVAARSVERGRLVAPAVLLDASGLADPQIVHEVGRQVALATLARYGVADDSFLTDAVAEALTGSEGGPKEEEIWIAAAAPLVDFQARPSTLGRLWVEELLGEAGGEAFAREAWERAAESGEAPLPVLLRMFTDATGRSDSWVLLRCAARLYASLEPEASPSRVRLLDLESGALDAAAPAAFSVRHRAFLPEEAEDTLRVRWPDDGGAGAAVVRYRDALLPPDVVFLVSGDVRAIPLAGVARIDWLVAGANGGARDLRAPVYCERSTTVPFAALEAHAAPGAGGPRLTWTTASHEGLWGWVIFREEVLPDGRIVRTGPQIVPSSESSKESFGYVFMDRGAAPVTFYRYTVWAVTDEGLLARAFAVTLKTD